MPWDVVTDDGTLVKGILEGDNLEMLRRILRSKYHVPRDLVWLNTRKRRLEVAPWVLEELAADLEADAFIIEEYPTADSLEVERRRLA